MSTRDELTSVITRLEDEMRKIVAGEGEPYDAGLGIWRETQIQ